MGPYLGLGFVLIAIAFVFVFQKSPKIVEEYPSGDLEGKSPLKILLSNKHYVFGVIAQFFNVAAQVCTWTYLIQYSQQALNGSLPVGRIPPAGEPDRVPNLAIRHDLGDRAGPRDGCARSARGTRGHTLHFCDVFSNMAGVVALVAVSFCLSLMFPTIYGVALQGLGPATKFGAAGLVMAIVGGAIMPLIQGPLLDDHQPRDLVRGTCCLLRSRDQFCLLRSEGRTNPVGERA